MQINFKAEAVEFVRDNSCACHAPVELIQKAMEHGAMKIADRIGKRLTAANLVLEKKRRDSRPHDHQYKPLEAI